jgi:hypothetical protein
MTAGTCDSTLSNIMHAQRQLAALFLGTVSVVALGTAQGQAPAPAPAAAGLPAVATPAKSGIAVTAKSTAAVDLPVQVFADGTTAAGETKAASPADAKKQERMQKIRQLTFDRRPAVIFKAWSTPRDDAIKNGLDASPPAGAPPMTSAPGVPAARARVTRRVVNGVVVTQASPPPVAIQEAAPGAQPQAAASSELDSFDRELRGFQYDVTLGDWASVKAFLARLPEDEGKAAYEQLVQSLGSPPAQGNAQMQQMQMQQMQMQMQMQINMGMVQGATTNLPPNPQQFMLEKHAITNQDVLDLARAAPHGLDDERVSGLGRILRMALDSGSVVEDFLTRLRAVLKLPPAEAPLLQRQAAKLLIAADCLIEAGDFLPTPEKAEADNDREALNLLARHYLAVHAREKKTVHLERAWKVTQAALAAGKVDRAQKDEAIRRAVELTPKIREALGRAWLEESFTSRPERGLEIIAAIGSGSAQGLQTHAFDIDFRLKSLALQKLAVEALLRKAPQLAKTWSNSLALLAEAWLREAEFSYHYDFSTSLGPRMYFDPYGNSYYSNYDPFSPEMMARQRGAPMAVKVADLVKERPGDSWVAFVDEGIKPKFATVFAKLYLKVNEEDEAFPYIERLAHTNPRQAKELAEEFVRVWTKNHDPNSQQIRRSRFFYIYGFDNRAEGIPLTRSKQERNLVELSGWVKKLRALPIGEIDEKLLTQAFTTCHSSAEVYRLDAIEKVFGSFDALRPQILAELCQQMRGNLVGVWRQPAEQEKSKTKRREKDIRAEVLRGYELARGVIDRGLAKHPDAWALVLARAALMHDENNYLQEIERSPEFAPRRQRAFAEFRRAAALYAKAAPSLEQNDETTQVFDFWYCAGLGACDPQNITEETLSDQRQPRLIREAIATIAGEAGERHMSKFANALFTRLSQVKPSIKFRYLKAGIEIVGDNPQAYEARKVFAYYKDLVTEIQLEAKVDGGDVVGHEQPFGVFVNLRHTREIERESGGFGRYLQNQNNSGYFYYNFGRPLENYRDKFQDAAKQALQEHFEVMSVTFQDEKVNSKATNEYGWRVTPYAYLLLKARGPKVDTIPPLRLDLDFMDTSGYVVLPVESPTIPVDATPAKGSLRPFEKLQLTQTLDERQAGQGKLIVEIKAAARGLVPELDELVALDQPGFEREKIDDQGVSVTKFDQDSPATLIDSERTWLVTYRPAGGQSKPPSTFRFASAKVDPVELAFQRYVDADLAKVGPEVPLQERYEQARYTWLWWAGGGILALAFAVVAIRILRSGPRRGAATKFKLPEQVTPFSVLGLLREIEQNNGMPAPAKAELAGSIERIERHYFAESDGESVDLKQVAETWISRAS